MSAEARQVHCNGCGWETMLRKDLDPATLAAFARMHFLECPQRFRGHPAFGFEARWQSSLRYDDEGQFSIIEIAWTIREWGFPFNLEAA